MTYSFPRIVREALRANQGWTQAWRDPEPKTHYDVLVIGGGGHGLATAYYLAKEHGITNVAVLEKGWIGGGNAGRNTTIIRSNYLLPGNERFYEKSMQLWEGLEQDLNYNAMVSQRGVVNLFQSDAQRDAAARRGNSMRLHGAGSELLDLDAVRRMCPFLDFDNPRFPTKGALLQRRGGTARHDAVVWGYARGGDRRGVDILQNCEVTGMRIEQGRVLGVETTRGFIGAGKVGMAVAGNTTRVADMAGIRLPIESHVLQAFVSEAIKPMIDTVVTFGAGHFYISQSDKGSLVFGGDIDGYNSYAQRGSLPLVEDVMECCARHGAGHQPAAGVRSWGGIMDMSMDGSPIIDRTPIDGLFLNAGWCYGGFKATPASGWCFAHTIATGQGAPPQFRDAIGPVPDRRLAGRGRQGRAAEQALSVLQMRSVHDAFHGEAASLQQLLQVAGADKVPGAYGDESDAFSLQQACQGLAPGRIAPRQRGIQQRDHRLARSGQRARQGVEVARLPSRHDAGEGEGFRRIGMQDRPQQLDRDGVRHRGQRAQLVFGALESVGRLSRGRCGGLQRRVHAQCRVEPDLHHAGHRDGERGEPGPHDLQLLVRQRHGDSAVVQEAGFGRRQQARQAMCRVMAQTGQHGGGAGRGDLREVDLEPVAVCAVEGPVEGRGAPDGAGRQGMHAAEQVCLCVGPAGDPKCGVGVGQRARGQARQPGQQHHPHPTHHPAAHTSKVCRAYPSCHSLTKV